MMWPSSESIARNIAETIDELYREQSWRPRERVLEIIEEHLAHAYEAGLRDAEAAR